MQNSKTFTIALSQLKTVKDICAVLFSFIKKKRKLDKIVNDGLTFVIFD